MGGFGIWVSVILTGPRLCEEPQQSGDNGRWNSNEMRFWWIDVGALFAELVRMWSLSKFGHSLVRRE